MKKLLPIFSFFILACFLLFASATAYAQLNPARVITIVPPSKEVSLNPGERIEGILKVVNDSNEILTFDASIRDYVVNDNQGTPDILPPNTLSNKFSAASWVAVFPSSFTVQPHQRQELNYYMQVPADARPGGHYAAVLYEPAETIGVQGTGTTVATHVGTLFYIDVKGPITEAADVVKFAAKGFQEYGPVTIATEILNRGDLHIRPKGTLTLKNMLGQTVAQEALTEHNIFPEKSFLYSNKFGHKWMIGRYTAKFVGTYGQNNNLPLVASVSFIIFPWKFATIAVLIIIAIILAIVAYRKRKQKHHKKEEETPTPENHPTL